MSKAKFQVAREYIEEKKYKEARQILSSIDHPKAKEWLERLDKLEPRANSQLNPVVIGVVILALLIGIAGLGFGLITLQKQEVASLPTQVDLPTVTATDTSSAIPTETEVSSSVVVSGQIFVPTITPTFTPSLTPTITLSPTITNTSPPTFTPSPEPTNTPRPTQTPRFQPVSQTIGPIYDVLADEGFTVQVTVLDVEYDDRVGFYEAGRDKEYAMIDISFSNLGPGSISNLSSYEFQAMNPNGVLYSSTWLVDECDFDIVALRSGATVEGCIAFEIPEDSSFSFVYAPYQYGNLEEGRYINIPIR